MSASEKLTFSLPAKEARYIEALVQSGAYSSASEVVRAGLRALQERDASIDQWLREEVIPVYDAMQRDPGRALSGEQLIADIRAHHVKRLKSPPASRVRSSLRPRRATTSFSSTIT